MIAENKNNRKDRLIVRLLDAWIKIPGTNIRVGLDPILGLIPVVGDSAGLILSGLLLLEGAKAGLPARKMLRMIINILIDSIVGSAPLLGDIFDVAWKANTRNAEIIDEHLRGKTQQSKSSASWWMAGGYFIIIGIVIFLAMEFLIQVLYK